MFLLQRGTYISVSRMWGRSPCITVTVPYDRPVTLRSDNRDVSRLITGPTHPCGISIMSHYCNKLAVHLAAVQSACRCTVCHFAHARPIMFSISLVPYESTTQELYDVV